MYSLDAFIGIVLVVMIISLLSASQMYIGNFYPISYQAMVIASDTLKMLISSGDVVRVISDERYCSSSVGSYVPDNFGFVVEVYTKDEEGNSYWQPICFRGSVSDATITVQSVKSVLLISEGEKGFTAVDFGGTTYRVVDNPYNYTTCDGYTPEQMLDEDWSALKGDRSTIKNPVDIGRADIRTIRIRVFQ